MKFLRSLAASLLFLASLNPATAVPAQDADPSFDIRSFKVENNQILSPELIQKTLAPFTGSQRHFRDVEEARKALQQRYLDRGLSTVTVVIPEQEVSQGIIRFRVQENRIAKISVFGAYHHDDANIRQSMPNLREGEVPNLVRIAESLRLANENPSKETHLLMRPTGNPGEIEALIRVDDEKPWKAFTSLDNTGDDFTGELRWALGYQHSNLLNRDHVLTLRAITSPGHFDEVKIFGAGYRIPLYEQADVIDLYAGYSDVDSGNLAGLFDVSGAGTLFGARYTHSFDKHGPWIHRLAVGLDYRDYEDKTRPVLGLNGPQNVTVRPLSLIYALAYQDSVNQGQIYISLFRNLPGGQHGSSADFENARSGAETDYLLWQIGGQFARALPKDWQLQARLDAQFTSDRLVPGEQFALGGMDNVRGFHHNTIGGDQGYRLNLELYTPDLGELTTPKDDQLRFLAFGEGGETWDNLPRRTADETISSVGFGLRYSWKKNLNLSLDLGRVIDGTPSIGAGEHRIHGSISYVY